ncbi:MAG: deoxyguanosinetriphosphate triphosphohydrolase [Christensenellales bacterium]|jgi:dGTPase
MKEIIYEIEDKYLSQYASKSTDTKGRQFMITPCEIRTEYVRDRDRIIHSKSFRRLKHKTQVFLAPEGDHYRTRLTHTLEVVQIARTISRALRLNEDLTEAIALGHDLGHTPFGHSGERTLNRLSEQGFKHNEQSLRVVDILENSGKGLNLTYEVRDGILNHKLNCSPSTLEGRVVSYSDRIAYINHDIEDAIRAEILDESSLPKEATELFGDSKGKRIDSLIKDFIANSRDKADVGLSSEYQRAFDLLKRFMDENIYIGSSAKLEESKADKMLELLYNWFVKAPEKLPPLYHIMIDKYGKSVAVCDYIASMTDRYAVKVFEDIYMPLNWDKL